LRSMLFFRARAVRLILDNGFDEIVPVSTVAVANGQYFGGGMRIAPNAVPDDGLFDIVVIAESKKTGTAAGLKQIYSGEHLNNPAVRVFRSRKLTAAPIAQKGSKPVRVEADGESAGLLPATFEILPGALRVKC
ncbi:MAG: diacylglycerol kinase family lipid kinase, partial [Alphaproteobacteria bacterium]|nr:diacylglycerol kinase family lipid kinase [Alphaproteobacteria bacterium]